MRGLLRTLLRIGRPSTENDGDSSSPILPLYPPDDTLSLGSEEVLVTVALLLVTYLVLSIPCRRRTGSGGWIANLKRLGNVRSLDDFTEWRRHLRVSVLERPKFDQRRWDSFLRLRDPDGGSDSERTVRVRGGRSAPSTPLRSFFRPLASGSMTQQGIHSSTSEGYLPKRADCLGSKFKGEEEGEGHFDKKEFRPETDHDRFQRAWESHIQFSEYRRLVLPPECKLVEFASTWREVEQSLLENFLDESRLVKITSYVRNMYDLICGIWSKLSSRESTRQFSTWIIGVFRYRWRRQRGLSVDDEGDDTDDEDDGSVITQVSCAGRMSSAGKKPNPKDTTPVVGNRKSLGGLRGILMKGSAPPFDSVPQIPTDTRRGRENDSSLMNPHCQPNLEKRGENGLNKIKLNPRPKTTEMSDGAKNNQWIAGTDREAENDSSLMNVCLSPNPEGMGEMEKNGEVGLNKIESGSRSSTMDAADDATFMSASGLPEQYDGSSRSIDASASVECTSKNVKDASCLPATKHTPNRGKKDGNRVIYTSALASEAQGSTRSLSDDSFGSLDVPKSVERAPKSMENISPLPPTNQMPRQRRKDALESYRRPETIPALLPSLKFTPEPKQGEMVPPTPSPKIAKPNSVNTSVDSSSMNFFDTADSSRQLRDMSRAVPIPDANGYILGDEFLPSTSCAPLLVFVNSRSGPQQGGLLITQFRRLLNPIQVWDLANGGPERILRSFLKLSGFQVLVCGGDGTVSWIISALEGMEGLRRWPPIGILPLGTGNDLARIHGWGGGYNNESLLYILHQISEAFISMLDLWELDITSMTKKGRRRKEVKSFTNYLGVGVDAQAALQVHNLRESKPKLFFSRFFNKAWYAIAGGEEALKSSCADLCRKITLIADGVEIPLPPDSQGIIFLNIDSYSGGVPMWSNGLKPLKKRARRYSDGDFLQTGISGLVRVDSIDDLAEIDVTRELTVCDLPSSCQDGLLDVVSIRGAFHLGQIRVGLSNAQLLCQCREAEVTLKKKLAVQIDGEPWRQPPSTLRIVRKPDRANMLNRSADDSGGVETEVTKLLNWANKREVIDAKQYALLMEEFSRRREHKRRKQKERGIGFSFVG